MTDFDIATGRDELTDTDDQTGGRTTADPDGATDGKAGVGRGPPRDPERPSPTDDDRVVLATLTGPSGDARVGLPGVLATTVGFVLGAGLAGAVAGVVTGLLWFGTAPVYTVAGGAAVLAALGLEGLSAAVVALGLGLVFLSPIVSLPQVHRRHVLASLIGAGAVLGGVLAIALDATSLPLAAAALAGTIALGLYAVHRVSLVRVVFPSTGTSARGRPVDERSSRESHASGASPERQQPTQHDE